MDDDEKSGEYRDGKKGVNFRPKRGLTALRIAGKQEIPSITAALDLAVTMPEPERLEMAERARAHALQFDRMNVFDRLLERVDKAVSPGPVGSLAIPSRLALR